MRRTLLIVAFSLVVVADIMFLPFALWLIAAGWLLGSLHASIVAALYVALWGVLIGGALIWLTRIAFRALRNARTFPA